jgi:hypothetical protein
MDLNSLLNFLSPTLKFHPSRPLFLYPNPYRDPDPHAYSDHFAWIDALFHKDETMTHDVLSNFPQKCDTCQDPLDRILDQDRVFLSFLCNSHKYIDGRR